MIRPRLQLAAYGVLLCVAATLFGAELPQSTRPRGVAVILVAFSPHDTEPLEFKRALGALGYSIPQDLLIDVQSAEGSYMRLEHIVRALLKQKVDLFIADTTAAAEVAKKLASEVPIVLAIAADPVASGLAQSLAYPGGNITGVSLMTTELTTKRLQLLTDVVPRLSMVGVLWNPQNPVHHKSIEDLKAHAASLRLDLVLGAASRTGNIAGAISRLRQSHVQALYVMGDALFFNNRSDVAKFAEKARLPAIYSQRQNVEVGGLIAYGANTKEMFRKAAVYADHILKGAKPAALPIEQPTQFELVVNLKTAKALGITIPESILLRADEVIR